MISYKSIIEKWNSEADEANQWHNLSEDEKIEFTIQTVMNLNKNEVPEFKPLMIPVVSSNISSVGYDDNNQIVYVQFLNGSMYAYKNVPGIEFDFLLNSPSIGSYFNRFFKNNYKFEKCNPS